MVVKNKTISALSPTIAKKRPVDSGKLESGEKRDIKAGWSCAITAVQGYEAGHVEVVLDHKAGTWWFYQPHVRVITGDRPGNLADAIVGVIEGRGWDTGLCREPSALNLIGLEGFGITGQNPITGKAIADPLDAWNDTLVLLSFGRDGTPLIRAAYLCTTEPGYYYTSIAPNPAGAARIALGYHPRLWGFGIHRDYEALTQEGSPVRLVRDRNENGLRDDRESTETWRGINLHTTRGWVGDTIGQWSAGCTVVKEPNQFEAMKRLLKTDPRYVSSRGHRWDYVLLWGDWVDDYAIVPTAPVSAQPSYLPSHLAVDLDTLARTIYGEARGESPTGRAAVGWVVRNRAARSPKYGWPSAIAEVCRQPWQFSCWNDTDPNLPKLKAAGNSDPLFVECVRIAGKVLSGSIADPTGGADHYYAKYINTPDWATGETPTAEIGVHRFYQKIGPKPPYF